MLDGQPFPMYKAVLVKKGQKLMFAGARNGSRGYIAFAGGLDIPLVMGSKSTLLRNHIGGVEGRKLEKGDTIEFTAPKTELPNMELRHVPAEVYPSDEVVLRVVLDLRRMSLQKRVSASFSGTAVPLPMSLTVWDAVLRENR